ncbi:hypothetical protein AJ79_03296 [Helicocarpus griseus UAMH5409]|uniref:Uncharacterized protein n=1 Tax=Helicocarpus griseus UAMH5409 TaxID=1447875 RepID=A0A2B7XZX6_9EURO|nr:hypothetical protein AJ79_03296 [Helicocarpus griseus UAMH5409]
MRSACCVAAFLTLVLFTSGGPILGGPRISPSTTVAYTGPSYPPDKKAAEQAPIKRFFFPDINDIFSHGIEAEKAQNKICTVVVDAESGSTTTKCGPTANQPPPSPSVPNGVESPDSMSDKGTGAKSAVVTPPPSPPPDTTPSSPDGESKPPAILALITVSSQIVPAPVAQQDPDTQKNAAAAVATAIETPKRSEVGSSPNAARPKFNPFAFAEPFFPSWVPVPGGFPNVNSIMDPFFDAASGKVTDALDSMPTDALGALTEALDTTTEPTTTIHLTSTFVQTVTVPPVENTLSQAVEASPVETAKASPTEARPTEAKPTKVTFTEPPARETTPKGTPSKEKETPSKVPAKEAAPKITPPIKTFSTEPQPTPQAAEDSNLKTVTVYARNCAPGYPAAPASGPENSVSKPQAAPAPPQPAKTDSARPEPAKNEPVDDQRSKAPAPKQPDPPQQPDPPRNPNPPQPPKPTPPPTAPQSGSGGKSGGDDDGGDEGVGVAPVTVGMHKNSVGGAVVGVIKGVAGVVTKASDELL